MGADSSLCAIDTYTLKAIGQDDFSDVPMPDAPIQTGATVGSTPSVAAPKAQK